MRPVLVVVADVLPDQPLHMPFIQHDYMVEQFPSAIPNPAFGDAILQRASEAGSLRLYAEAFSHTDNLVIEVRVAIENEISQRRIIRESLPKLLDDPCAARMPGNLAVQDPPPVMGDNEEAIEHIEGQRRHREEVH